MNHIYKVIWNKAKHCYTVVSEIAKSHSQSNKRVRSMTAVVAAAMMLTGFGGMAIEAANPASGDTNITIGKGASVSIWNGVTGHDGFTSGYISIGENAFAWDGEHTYRDKYARIGTKEYALDFNQGAVGGAESIFGIPYKFRVTDGTKLAGAIAIGKNTMARTGSVMIGDHTYKGQLGDIDVDPSNKATLNNGVYSTTLGTSSYNSGSMATVTGALSIASGNKDTKDTQNFGATIYGSLNSIESSTTSDSASGMANSVLGFGNRTQNANASLVWGTGNEVTNSIEDVKFSTNWNKTSASDAQKEIIKAMQSSQFAGGSVMAIGGGNKADWATYSQLLGVQNTLTGTEKDVSTLTLINGYKNAVTNAQNTTIIGSNNTATNIKSTIVMGDHNTLEGRKNVISLGNKNTVVVDDAVAIGNSTKVTAESGVAIGVGSVADRVAGSEKGALGYFAPETIPTAEKSTWTSTKGAVSVGDTVNNITRQITNVAAGREDTDAVNVAQLKKVNEEAGKHSVVTEGANITVTPEQAEDGRMQYNVALNNNIRLSGDNDAFVNISGSNGSVWASSSVAAGNVIMDGTTATVSGLGNTTTAYDGFANGEGKAATEEQLKEVSKVAENANQGWNLSTNGGEASKVAPGETVDISGDKNIKISNDGTNVKVKLNDNIDVNSVQTNALNAKYNLSVGTANENGTVPFFVNSNGAFYAANGKLVVDKDGKVTATEGEIGNVVLKNGVLYKNTALRDGELYVGDADGNYSQITPKSAKLGQVTIDEKGNMAGVNSIQTNALNAKYNLSVGTAADNGTMPFFVNSNGAFYAAGGEFVVDKDGSVKATSGDIGNVKLNDGVFYKNSALRDGELYVGDADGNYSQITSKNAKLGKVMIDDTGRISGVAAGEISSTSTDAVNGSQLHAVQQEAGKHTKVVNGSNITVEETDQDGQKTYKVGLNKDLLLGDITGKNVSISGTNGTIETTGFIATKDKIYADKGAKLADVNVTGDTISNDKSSVKLDKDGTVTINKSVTIDQSGKISGVAVNVNSVQTNALNSKYNLSVGTAAADGKMPFFVNSNGAFYAAGGEFVVDKDGSVKATSGDIGNVKLNDGVFYKNSALRDGELYVGDADGNYSQITSKNAKLGKVMIDDTGRISGVAAGEISSTSTDAVNGSQLHAVQQEAGKHTKVVNGSNITVEETDQDGQKTYKVGLNKDLLLGDITGKNVSISGTNGTIETTGFIATKDKIYADKGAKLADVNVAGDTISNDKSSVKLDKEGTVTINGKVNVDKAGQIHNVTAGTADEDAVNVSQLKKQAAASKTTVSDGTNTTVTSTVAEDGHTDYKVNLNKDLTGIESMTNGLSSIRMGNGGTVTINNRVTIDQSGKISGVAAGEVKEGSTDAVNGSQLKGVENKADKNAENIQKNTEAIAKNTADISKNAEAISKNTENIKNNSKAIAENAKNIQKNTEAIAKNTADISKNTEAIGKLDERVTSVEEVAKKHTTVSTDDTNVQISEDTNKDGGKDYKVSLNKDLNLSSVTTGDTKMDTNGVTVKDVSLTKDGLSIGNKTYVSNKGLNANDQKVTNVAAGDISEKSTDAVNGSQLFATNQQVVQNAQSISKLGNRINKVGAGAAALAALHPLDFDPDDKWDIAAGYGNYNGENAAAIGAYYRPNEDTMFSVGGSFGNGENMVNAGVSLKLGQGNHVSTSKVAMAKEIKDLRKELEGLKSALLDVNAGKKLDTSKLQLFPDVPKNHWAYEYVSTLKGNGVLTGYPDGEFKGDRPMTRYEFATMLYKAMLEGATLSDKILKEFAPELERFTVDTVHQDKDGKPTVERVRTVKAEK